MIRTELDAAGIDDVRLRAAYRHCRQIAAENGRTYFLATRLLAPDQRPAVHALYGFARHADDILDELNPALDVSARAERLQALSDRFFDGGEHARRARLGGGRRHRAPLRNRRGSVRGLPGLDAHGPHRHRLSRTAPRSTATCADPRKSLGCRCFRYWARWATADEAAPYAAALGRAFQLTNFLRDVDEDLPRNRIYLPADELAAFGVDRELMTWCHLHRRTDARVRDALAAQHHITRDIYRFAADGIALLAPRSRPCVATALTLYSEILDRIEDSDFSVFSHRATVGMTRRLQVAGGGLLGPGGCARGMSDRWQYLIVLGLCLAITAPLEFFGAGVYRQPRRLLQRGASGRGGVSGLGRGGHRGRRVDVQRRLHHRHPSPLPAAHGRGAVLRRDSGVRLTDLQRGDRHPGSAEDADERHRLHRAGDRGRAGGVSYWSSRCCTPGSSGGPPTGCRW